MVMAENARTGFVWDTFMKNPEARRGMERAGFKSYRGSAAARVRTVTPPDDLEGGGESTRHRSLDQGQPLRRQRQGASFRLASALLRARGALRPDEALQSASAVG